MNYLQKELYELTRNDDKIFEFIQHTTQDGMWYWDLENPEEEWMSPKFWISLGYDPKEMPHKSSAWQNIIHSEDLELAKKENTDNPVYYIQYAHARIQSIMENLDEDIDLDSEVDLSNLTHEAEMELMKMMAHYPEMLKLSAERKEAHHVANYAYDLANAFHVFYNKCRVLIDDEELMQARLQLVLASKQVLVNILDLLGISAPESM